MKIRKIEGNILPLKSDTDELLIFFVGVGSAFSKLNNQTNLILVKRDTNILIDCGTKTPQALYNLGHSVLDLENVLVTHSHADHIGGMEELFLMNRYVAKKKFNLIVVKDYKNTLWNYSLKGGSGFNECNNGKLLKLTDFCNILYPKKIAKFPREAFEINFKNINLKIFRTKHTPDNAKSWEDSFLSYGVIIDDKVLFSCDTRYDPDMIIGFDKIFNFEAIFHDCQLYPGGVHASLAELKQLSENIKKKTYLVHFGDNWQKFKPEDDGFPGYVQDKTFYIF